MSVDTITIERDGLVAKFRVLTGIDSDAARPDERDPTYRVFKANASDAERGWEIRGHITREFWDDDWERAVDCAFRAWYPPKAST